MLGKLLKIVSLLMFDGAGRGGPNHSRGDRAHGALGIRDQFRYSQSRGQI
jgi:hypothetical protein